MSIRSRLIMLILSLLIPAIAACAISAWIAQGHERKRAEQNMLNTVRVVAGLLDLELIRISGILGTLATAPTLDSGDLAGFWQQAHAVADQTGMWVVLTGADGQQLVNTLRRPGEPLPPHPRPDSVRKVFETGAPVVSGLFYGPVSRKPTLAVDVPVLRDGKVVFSLGMGILPEVFGEVLAAQPFPATWLATIFDDSKRIVARSHGIERFIGKQPTEQLLEEMSHGDTGIFENVALDNRRVLAAFSRSPRFGWYVALGAPVSAINAASAEIGLVVLGLGLLLSCIGLGAAMLIGRGISGPTAALAGPARALGHGDPVVWQPTGLAEVDRVAEAMQHAAELQRTTANAFRQAIIAAPLPVMLHSDDGRVLAVSDAWTRLSGYRAEEIETISAWIERAHGADRTQAHSRMRALFRSEGLSEDDGEFRIRTADGTHRIWSFASAPVGQHGDGVLLRVTMAADVTERKQAEERIEAACRAAERSANEKSRFIATASHDLRQPFQAMRLFCEVLRGHLVDHKAKPVADKLEEAMRGGEELLTALLDISVLDAGRVKVKAERFALSEVLGPIVAETRGQVEEKGLALRYVPTTAVVVSDRTLLARMVRNLVHNAIRYTLSGEILVGCRLVEAGVRIEVIDTGIGIPAEALPHLFDDYYQVDNDARDRSRGLGLGLSVVRRTAAMLGHEVSVHSQPGHGSRFTILVATALPLQEQALAS